MTHCQTCLLEVAACYCYPSTPDAIEPFRAEYERLASSTHHGIFVQLEKWSWRRFKKVQVLVPLDTTKHELAWVAAIPDDATMYHYPVALAVGRAAKALKIAEDEGPGAALLWKLSN